MSGHRGVVALTETQTVFMLFFAIMWGAVANVQPRWKAFQWPLLCRGLRPVKFRVALSVLLLNILPIVYFGWTMLLLGEQCYKVGVWNVGSVFRLTLHGVVPAFAAFAFYRTWLGIIELKPTWYYYEYPTELPGEYRRAEPTVAELWYPRNEMNSYKRIAITTGRPNLVAALVYFLMAVLSPFLWR
jgi:hypothetical protein